jgi:hypothetical protein
MALEYPDVMNDVTDARLRFESGSVQFLAEFRPGSSAAGSGAQLALVLQNTVEAPVHVGIRLVLPRLRRRLRRLPQPAFGILEPYVRLTLGDSEVGQLMIPVRIQPQVPPGEYAFAVQVESVTEQRASRTRPDHSDSRVGDLKIRHLQGLGITQFASWGYRTERAGVQRVLLKVNESADRVDDIELAPHFSTLWTPESWELITSARREVGERRLHAVSALTADALYVAFMRESQVTFAHSDVRLHVGEAIFVAKILAYTAAYLMGDVLWQDCLLVPIWAYARASEQPTGDMLWLVTQLGYVHVLELAIALSFSLIEQVLEREVWDVAEQIASRDFVAQCLSTGTPLPGEFLYLPLVLGGLIVADELILDGEDVQQSLSLLASAKAERADWFADQELREFNEVFDLLMARQEQSQNRF